MVEPRRSRQPGSVVGILSLPPFKPFSWLTWQFGGLPSVLTLGRFWDLRSLLTDIGFSPGAAGSWVLVLCPKSEFDLAEACGSEIVGSGI